ncbi:MAG: alpha/beta fold hydrolase [Halobacteriovoraceae bacterium]|nr:alpha/beta fold hydrolase [Halobacteriovoraceae bacterium]
MKAFLFLLLMSFNLFAISEKNFELDFKEKVIPYVEKNSAQKFIKLKFLMNKGEMLSYRYFNKGHNVLTVVLPGRAESKERYYELAYDLKDQPTDILVIDHLGQGLSQRYVEDIQKGHITDFDKYTSSIRELLSHYQNYQSYELIGHSMGAFLGFKLLLEKPHFFSEAVLFAPMFDIQTDPYSKWQARAIAKALVYTGVGSFYAPGRGPYLRPSEYHSGMRGSIKRLKNYDDYLENFPMLKIGGPTARWVYESIKSMDSFLERDLETIETPITIFRSLADETVKVPIQKEVCERVQKCQLIDIERSGHNLLQEKDELRDQAMNRIYSLFK